MSPLSGTAGTLAAEQRRLGHALAAASDAALARVVAVFDRLADRRDADRVLDAARPRLRRLRPPRPIALPRLLFLPLDGAIADARNWKRQNGNLPRSALVPLSEAVRAAIGDQAQAIEAQIAGHSFANLPVVGAAGLRLWQAAATATLAPPASWAATGLAATDFRHCAELAAGVWRHAAPLWAALVAARHGPPETLVQAALLDAANEPPIVAEAMLATLLMKAAKPGSVTAAAAAAKVGTAGMAEAMLDRWIADCQPDITAADPLGASRIAEEFAEAIADLDASPAGRQPERRQRIAALRHQADEACRAAFTEATRQALLTPLSSPGQQFDDAAVHALESAARSLKRLEQAGRCLGSAPAYDAAVRRITDAFRALRAAPGANIADLARLTEIIAGPEAAMRLLDG